MSNADWITSFEALKSVYTDGAYSNMALNEAIPRHKSCRDSFVRNMVKGTIRMTVTLDYIIGMLASNGLKGIKPRTLIILRMGLYAMREMDSVPDHAAVNEAVSLARKTAKGTDRFINAVLRSYLRRKGEFEVLPDENALNTENIHVSGKTENVHSAGVNDNEGNALNTDNTAKTSKNDNIEPAFLRNIKNPVRRLSVKYSMPEDLTALISEQYGEDAERVLAGLNNPPEIVLRVNTLKTTRDDLIALLESEEITAEPAAESSRAVIARGSRIIGSELYRQGLFTVQSLSSIIAVEALGPAEGSQVLDMCAAPGGKSTMMAELMGNTGRITACDIHEHRLELINASAKRTGADIIETRLADGTVTDESMAGSYDFVLADVPCSGLGVMSTKPEIRLRSNVSDFDELTDIQLEILRNAFRYAKPGARICYSTCTLNKAENEGVIRRFLGAQSGSSDVSAPDAQGNIALAESNGFARIIEMRTILPYNNVIGFYYCILEKNV